ncbi:uncharacterized protein LOC112090946 [Morus notabilis]|uniref:uncharacterized protein LOC112090946 n=1 Tax=Morus notabilis TaxID=981085 RepID=UPI000CECE6FF|nr:uncharacterized protein LOC112090946 [Morus notabilis]
MVDVGSYYGYGFVSYCQSPQVVSNRGVRGPMDRFLNNVDNKEANERPSLRRTSREKNARSRVCLDIGRFFYENAFAFNIARSPSYFNMCRSIGDYGRGLVPPSMHELRTWILKEEVLTTEKFVEQKDANLLFEMLDEIVKEVEEDLVVQVVTDNTSAYKAAGAKLMEKRKHLFWTPYAAHCIDLIFEKLGELPQHKRALLKAKKISNYVYNHPWVLSLMRKFTKRDIVRPAATRFATAYLTLECIYRLMQPLQSMFVSEEWNNSSYAKKPDGKEVKKIVMKDNQFWVIVGYVLKSTQPIVKVLRVVDSEKMPAMGFIYGAMEKAKEEIAKNLGGEEKDYKEIWEIIDEK